MSLCSRGAAVLLLLGLALPAQAFNGVMLWRAGGEAKDVVASQGSADPLRQRGRLDANTPLHIGSITKLFTAVLVLQQVGKGELTLDTAIGGLLPELPAAAGTVTVRQLLQHRSGLAEWQAEPIETEGQPPQVVAAIPTAQLNTAILARASEAPRAAPGAPFFYNNTDYLLLGLLLERQLGRPYPKLLEDRLLKPLGLKHSYLATVPSSRKVAPAATLVDGRLQAATATPLANYGAAGAMVSTAADLSRFAAALLDGRALPRAQRELLFAEGLSVWAYDFADPALAAPVAAVERQGSVGAYRSTLVLLPERGGWLIVLANSDAGDYSTWMPTSFTHRLLSGLLQGQPPQAALDAVAP